MFALKLQTKKARAKQKKTENGESPESGQGAKQHFLHLPLRTFGCFHIFGFLPGSLVGATLEGVFLSKDDHGILRRSSMALCCYMAQGKRERPNRLVLFCDTLRHSSTFPSGQHRL